METNKEYRGVSSSSKNKVKSSRSKLRARWGWGKHGYGPRYKSYKRGTEEEDGNFARPKNSAFQGVTEVNSPGVTDNCQSRH